MKNHDKAWKPDFQEERILLVEDNDLNRVIVKKILETEHLVVEIAENGRQALDMFSNSAPRYYDLILMDISMPVMNGYEAAREIRKLMRPDSMDIPIIAVTTKCNENDIRQGLLSGMNAHIEKPVNPVRLLEKMMHYLKPNKNDL